jgi:acetolactate synthase-1/2/3 large subunit
MTGAEMVVQALKDQGVEVVFGYPGGAVLPIYDEIFQQNAIRHILVRHEQGAVHAAEGYARATGKPGVVLVTSGPGATNAVTGLTDALMDSIPMVVLTGPGADLHDRQRRLPGGRHRRHHPALHQAQLAGEGHRPAVRHDPRGVPRRHHRAAPARCWSTSRRTCSSPPAATRKTRPTRPLPAARQGRPATIEALVEAMETAERPVFYTGGGVINSGPKAPRSCAKLVEATGFPDHLDADGPGRLPGLGRQLAGHAGDARLYEANLAMHGCDLMINVGARFDDRITGRSRFLPEFAARRISTSTRPRSTRSIHADFPIIGDVAMCWRTCCASGRRAAARRTPPPCRHGGSRSRPGAR